MYTSCRHTARSRRCTPPADIQPGLGGVHILQTAHQAVPCSTGHNVNRHNLHITHSTHKTTHSILWSVDDQMTKTCQVLGAFKAQTCFCRMTCGRWTFYGNIKVCPEHFSINRTSRFNMAKSLERLASS